MFRVKRQILPACILLLLMAPQVRVAQRSSTPSTQLLIETGTPVKLQLAQTISSRHVHKGDRLDFLVQKAVVVEGLTVIVAGAKAEGSVVRVHGKRPLGIGGNIVIKLDTVELATGQMAQLSAHKQFKQKSRTMRMVVGMAITAAIYLPTAPVFLLTPGRDCTVLKGTELTAYTKTDFSVDAKDLLVAPGTGSDLSEMVKLLPPRVMNGEGREGDMLNLIFAAQENDLRAAFANAGWVKVEKSAPQIIWHLSVAAKTLRQATHGQALRFWKITGLFVCVAGSYFYRGAATPPAHLENRSHRRRRSSLGGCRNPRCRH